MCARAPFFQSIDDTFPRKNFDGGGAPCRRGKTLVSGHVVEGSLNLAVFAAAAVSGSSLLVGGGCVTAISTIDAG